MNMKKLKLPVIFFAVMIVAYIIASVVFCYTTKPEIKTGEFPFSITYEYKGEINKLSGVYKCEFSGSDTVHSEQRRYWESETVYDNPKNLEEPFVIDSNEEMLICLFDNMEAGYFMGDPMYADHYINYGSVDVVPRIQYQDHKKDISYDGENAEEIYKAIGFKVIDYTYPEPIENSFSFSGVSYEADNVIIFVLITFVFLLLCLIFVRKDKEYKYSKLDNVSIFLNFIVGLAAIPFLTLICIFYDLNGAGSRPGCQFAFNIPPVAILCLALSIVFRRKGIRKTGFYIQFVGILLFGLLLLLEPLLYLL